MPSSRNDGNREFRQDIRPLEVEMDALQPMAVRPSNMRQHPLEGFWMLTKLYIESYPKIATVVAFFLIGCLMLFLGTSLQAPVTRNRISHDYTAIDYNYNFRASQIDHWCLFVSTSTSTSTSTVLYCTVLYCTVLYCTTKSGLTNNKVDHLDDYTLSTVSKERRRCSITVLTCCLPHSR
jgi:hypothetical protein